MPVIPDDIASDGVIEQRCWKTTPTDYKFIIYIYICNISQEIVLNNGT